MRVTSPREWHGRRAFISYKFADDSSRPDRDVEIDAEIRSALRLQGILVRSMRLSLGTHITDGCRAQISLSDVFIAIVSSRAMNSPHCVDEIEFALSERQRAIEGGGRPIEIFAIYIDLHDHGEAMRTGIPSPYDQFGAFVCLYAAALSPREIADEIVASICQVLGVPWRQPVDHPSTPLFARVDTELRQLVSEADRRLESFRIRLQRCRESSVRFDRAYHGSDGATVSLDAAAEALNAVIAYAEHEDIFYPRLLLGIVQLDLADLADTRDERDRHIGNARSIVEPLLGRPGCDPEPPWDESMYLVRGITEFKAARFEAAMEHFREAHEAGDPEEPTTIYYLVLCALRHPGSTRALLDELNLAASFWDESLPLSVREPADQTRLRLLLCVALVSTGRFVAAMDTFMRIPRADLAVHGDLVHLLAEQTRHEACALDIADRVAADRLRGDALRVVECVAAGPIDSASEARHHLRALLLFECGRRQEAADLYDRLLARDDTRSVYLLERGLIHEINGRRRIAKNLYRRALQERPQEGRYDRNDLIFPAELYRANREYAKGYAHWRLGAKAGTARAYFRESHRDKALWWYPHVDARIGIKKRRRW